MKKQIFLLTLAALWLATSTTFGQTAGSTCGDWAAGNPCGSKAAGNPCGAKAAGTVTGATAAGNPCGAKAAGTVTGATAAGNPCGSKAAGTVTGATSPGNPCGAKAALVFEVSDPMNRNTVTFKSTAPLEDIVGTSSTISGRFVFDPSHPEEGSGELNVPVASLRTGIPLRDEHLVSADWLDAERYPNITFKAVRVKSAKLVQSTGDAQTFDITAVGDFSLHGTTKRLELPLRVTYLKESEQTRARMPGDLLAVRTSYSVPLEDYGITGPQGMNLIGSKVGNAITVEFSAVASSGALAMAGDAGNPCGGKATMSAENPCGAKAENPCNPCAGKKPR